MIVVRQVTLSDISIAIRDTINRFEEKNIFLVFDSITTLLIYYPEKDILQFLHTLTLKLKQLGVSAFFLAVDQEMGRDVVKTLATVCDEFIRSTGDEV